MNAAHRLLLLAIVTLCTTTPGVFAQTELTAPDLATFKSSITEFMRKHCVACHGPDVQEGDVRLDTINGNLVAGDAVDLWKDVLHRLETGEMPPKDEPQPSEAERDAVSKWIRREIEKHITAQVGVPGRVVVRRLSRTEYSNTMRDLLGLPYDMGADVTPDTMYEGFDHIASVQELSPAQLRTYLDLARFAINKAIPEGPRPISVEYRHEVEQKRALEWIVRTHGEEQNIADWPGMKDQNKPKAERLTLPSKHDVWEKPQKGGGPRVGGETVENGVWLQSAIHPYKNGWGYAGWKFPYIPKEVDMIRLRIKAGAEIEDGRGYPLMSIHILHKLLGHFEVTADANDPQWYEFLVAEQDLVKHPALLHDDARFHKRKETDLVINNGYENPGIKTGVRSRKPTREKYPRLFVDAIEIEYNFTQPGPTKVQKRILFDSRSSNDPQKYAAEVLKRFMTRAFRRPVRDDELSVQMEIFQQAWAKDQEFVPAIKEALIATLVSPQFLFLFEDDQADERRRRRLNDYEVASRLSYFLWSTMPDAELLDLAASGKLSHPGTLTAQVDRMLQDDRADNFYSGFMTQWLRIDLLDELMIEDERWRRSYQLKDAMKQETIAFFAELARNDHSLMSLIDSEFAVVNERMALHYDIPNVLGNSYRPVSLEADSARGGLLTQASCMALTTDGMITSPIYRGKWILEKILDMPPPEAPANVPPLEDAPKVRLSLSEQSAKPSEDKNRAACHKKIDPVGWPFEHYSLLGEHSIYGWGENWRKFREPKSIARGDKPDVHGILPDGTRVESVADLQQVILKDYRRDVLRSVTKNMLIYALGRPLDLSDDPVIDGIIQRVESRNDSTRELVRTVVLSNPFLEK